MGNRIIVDPKVYHGQAGIMGTCISVHQILRMLATGDILEDFLREYPFVTSEDVLACFDYAASLKEKRVTQLNFSRIDVCVRYSELTL